MMTTLKLKAASADDYHEYDAAADGGSGLR